MFLTYLGRELRRRARSAVLVALGLAVGIGLVITVTAASAGVRAAQGTVLHSLYGVGTDISVTQAAAQGSGGPQRFNLNPQNSAQEGQSFSQDRVFPAGGTASFAASSVTTVKRLPHVASVAGGLALNDVKFSGQFARGQGSTGNGQQPGGGQGTRPSQGPADVDSFTIAGVDLAAPGIGPLSSVSVTSGRSFTSADAAKAVAVVDGSYASTKSLKVGSTVTVNSVKYSVIGLVSTPTGSNGSNVYLPLAAAQKLANLTDKVTTLYVKADSAAHIDAVQAAIRKALPKATVTTSSDLASQISGSLGSASSLANNLGVWLSVAVLAAAFLMAVLFTVSAVSRRVREFGTLKALGWRSRRVIGQVMGEAFAQGLIGGVAGIGLGFLGAFLVTRLAPPLSATVGASGNTGNGGNGGPGGGRFGGGFARAAEHTINVHLSASVTTTSLVLAVVLAVAGGVLAGTFGGWRAARMRPADALRRVE
jgi:ABC-type antimicrobial peptide transport system permease subunit